MNTAFGAKSFRNPLWTNIEVNTPHGVARELSSRSITNGYLPIINNNMKLGTTTSKRVNQASLKSFPIDLMEPTRLFFNCMLWVSQLEYTSATFVDSYSEFRLTSSFRSRMLLSSFSNERKRYMDIRNIIIPTVRKAGKATGI
jgi:hypothetical protein